MGNKKVSIIQNIDSFGIDLAEFSTRIQKAAAASASVASDTVQGRVIVVQGNQVSETEHMHSFLSQIARPQDSLSCGWCFFIIRGRNSRRCADWTENDALCWMYCNESRIALQFL